MQMINDQMIVLLRDEVILMKCAIKNDGKFYLQISLEKAQYNEQAQRKALEKYISKELMTGIQYATRYQAWLMLQDEKKSKN